MRGLLCIIMMLLSLPSAEAQNVKKTEQQFRAWLNNDLWPEARRAGISRQNFATAFDGVTLNWKLPDLVPPGTKAKPGRTQSQAEFRSPGRYFRENNIQPLVRTGRQLFSAHKNLISRIEKQYGVPGRIILAIWGRESAFGRVSIPNDVFQVLATKAFMSTRKELFRKELLSALTIIEKKYATRASMKSSWAGAMGQPQFLPSSYLEYAVDFDGDGRRDIWRSVPDTLASIANYLRAFGWQTGRDWGYEARITTNISCALEGPDQMRPIYEWQSYGARRISGKAFPDFELRQMGAVLMPAGRAGPAFIATPNFYVIKKYNNSDLYALFVGNVADRIQYANKPFVADWQSISGLNRGNVISIQNGLIKLGYDVGGADGLAGFKTRRAIGDWQTKKGLRPTCFPDSGLAARF